MASCKIVNIEGVGPIFIRIGDFRACGWFEIVENLARDFSLGELFIDRCIHEMLQTERKIVPWHSKPLAILSRKTPICSTNPYNRVFKVNENSQDDDSSDEFN